MSDFDATKDLIWQAWGNKTLEDLRVEAEHTATGIAYESIRVPGGEIRALIVCVTDMDQIERLLGVLDLVDDGDEEDWNELTLLAIAVRNTRMRGIAFEPRRDEFQRLTALALSAVEPDSITSLGQLFEVKS